MRAPTSEQIRAAARIVATTTVVGHAEPGAGDAFRLTITALHERAERVQKAEEYEAMYAAADLEVALLIADTVDGTPDDYLDAAKAIREHFAQPGDTQDDNEPAPATIPADATGLKGRRARVVGPVGSHWSTWGFTEDAEVRIDIDHADEDGYLHVSRPGDNGGTYLGIIAASSLALIPDEPEPCFCGLPDGPGVTHRAGGPCYVDEPEAVPEPPVGTRLRDEGGHTWERYSFGWSFDPNAIPRKWAGMLAHSPLHQVWERAESVPAGVTVERGLNLARREPGGMLRYLLDNQETEGVGPFVAVEEFGATS